MRRQSWGVAVAGVVLAIGLAGCGTDDGPTPGSGDSTQEPQTPTASTPATPEPEGPEALAQAFTDFAVGDPSEVTWAPEVTYLIAGTPVKSLDAARANSRSSWQGCPRGGDSYDGLSCPVSPLDTIKRLHLRDKGEVRFESAVPKTVGCNRVTPPRGLDPESSITIVPEPPNDSCFSAFAVTLYVDESDQVSAVNLVISTP